MLRVRILFCIYKNFTFNVLPLYIILLASPSSSQHWSSFIMPAAIVEEGSQIVEASTPSTHPTLHPTRDVRCYLCVLRINVSSYIPGGLSTCPTPCS